MGVLDRQVSETQIKLRSRLWLYILSAVILFLLIVPSLIVIVVSGRNPVDVSSEA